MLQFEDNNLLDILKLEELEFKTVYYEYESALHFTRAMRILLTKEYIEPKTENEENAQIKLLYLFDEMALVEYLFQIANETKQTVNELDITMIPILNCIANFIYKQKFVYCVIFINNLFNTYYNCKHKNISLIDTKLIEKLIRD